MQGVRSIALNRDLFPRPWKDGKKKEGQIRRDKTILILLLIFLEKLLIYVSARERGSVSWSTVRIGVHERWKNLGENNRGRARSSRHSVSQFRGRLTQEEREKKEIKIVLEKLDTFRLFFSRLTRERIEGKSQLPYIRSIDWSLDSNGVCIGVHDRFEEKQAKG